MIVADLMPASSPGEHLVDLEAELRPLEVAQVHAQQHLRPVGGVDPAGAGVDAHDGGAVVVVAEEERLPLQPGQLGLEVDQLLASLRLGAGVALVLGEVEQHLGILEATGEPGHQGDGGLDGGPVAW